MSEQQHTKLHQQATKACQQPTLLSNNEVDFLKLLLEFCDDLSHIPFKDLSFLTSKAYGQQTYQVLLQADILVKNKAKDPRSGHDVYHFAPENIGHQALVKARKRVWGL